MDTRLLIAVEGRRAKMLAVLDGCTIRKPRKYSGEGHPKRMKPIACATMGRGNKNRKEYRSCLRKVRYRSEGAAKNQIGIIHQHRPEQVLRAYYCEYCGGWHLTHNHNNG